MMVPLVFSAVRAVMYSTAILAEPAISAAAAAGLHENHLAIPGKPLPRHSIFTYHPSVKSLRALQGLLMRLTYAPQRKDS